MANRRLNGEGTVHRRSDGRWVAKVMINGKMKEFTSSKSEKEAVKKMKIYLKKDSNDETISSNVPFKDYILEWYRIKKEPNLKIRSAATLKGVIDNQIVPALGAFRLPQLSSSIIEDRLLNPLKKTKSYSLVKKAYDYTNACLKYAVAERHITYNPMLTVEKPRKVNFKIKKIDILTDEEQEKLLKAIDTQYSTGSLVVKNAYAFKVVLYSGLREGELFSLRWKDYNEQKRTLTVDSNFVCAKIDGKYKMVEQESTKTDAGTRVVPLANSCIDALNKIREMSNFTSDKDLIVCNKDGGPIMPSNFKKSLDALCKFAGIRHITPHSLRHTFASMLIRKGVDIKIVSELLGHSSIKITYDTYVHIIKEQKQQAISLLDEL